MPNEPISSASQIYISPADTAIDKALFEDSSSDAIIAQEFLHVEVPRLESVYANPRTHFPTHVNNSSIASSKVAIYSVSIPRRRYPASQYWTDDTRPIAQSEAVVLQHVNLPNEERIDDSEQDNILPDSHDVSSDASDKVVGDDYRTIKVSNVTIYHALLTNADCPNDNKRNVTGYMCMLSQILTSSSGTVYMDAQVVIAGTDHNSEFNRPSRKLEHVLLRSLSIGTSLEGPLELWVGTELSCRSQTWYKMLSSSCEYDEHWADSKWLSNFTRFAIGFLVTLKRPGHATTNAQYTGCLLDFKEDFDHFLKALPNIEAQEVRLRYGKSDYRQAFSVHRTFIWHITYEMDVQTSPVFDQVFCRSLKMQPWSMSDKTVVTPYVYKCFSHIFGNFMKVVQPQGTKVQELSHVEVARRIPEVVVTQPEEIHCGDFVRFKHNDDPDDVWAQRHTKIIVNKSRSRQSDVRSNELMASKADYSATNINSIDDAGFLSTPEVEDFLSGSARTCLESEPILSAPIHRDYMYVTEVLSKPTKSNPDRRVYRGLWCYQPGTWHTQLDTSYYDLQKSELFLSDHCNCPENYSFHNFAEFQDIECKVKVNLFSDDTMGCQFFCRFLYLHDEGNFVTLTRAHLDPNAARLPCDCLTKTMRTHRPKDYFLLFCDQYEVGDTVLLDVDQIQTYKPQTGRLDPFVIRLIDNDNRSITFSIFTRREDEKSGDQHIWPNELCWTNSILTLNSTLAQAAVIRKFDLWYHNTSDLPNQLQLNGSGEQFFLRGDGDNSTLPEHLCFIKFSILETPFKRLRGLDLFCGAGNLGEGIRDAGVVQYSSIVDIFEDALHSYQANHVAQSGDDLTYDSNFYLGSVNTFLESAMKKGRSSEIDFIVAGSPCQGFSQANLNKDSENSLRNCSLIANFASYIDFYRPKYAVLENVIGLGDNVKLPNGRIINVHRQLLATAVSLGYQVRTFTNHAWMHGSAQQRTRIFVIFAAPGLVLPRPPVQSHEHPPRQNKTEKLKGPHGYVYHNPMSDDSAPKAFRTRLLRDIWGDLPDIDDGLRPCITHPEHHIEARVSYSERLICRSYGGFARTVQSKVSHRYTKLRQDRVARTASEMHEMGAVPMAVVEANPVIFRPGSKAYGRTNPDRLLGTVLTSNFPRAKFGAPCIHYEQPRRYTIAEAKRAQGFLDHDVLLGSSLSKMKQIGNSVSRHVSYAIGLSIREAMFKNHENEMLQQKERREPRKDTFTVEIASPISRTVNGNGNISNDLHSGLSTDGSKSTHSTADTLDKQVSTGPSSIKKRLYATLDSDTSDDDISVTQQLTPGKHRRQHTIVISSDEDD